MPDFSIKAQKTYGNIKSQTMLRASVALNDLLGGTVRIGENDVLEILNKVEEYETETTYGYSQQKGIEQKPVLVFSGIELKTYSLNIKLHFDYCNPDDIIRRLEEKAELHEPFSYFQNNTYIGEYVINRIRKRILSQYEGVTLYAEIVVDILECAEDEKETEIQLPANTVSENRYKNPVEYVEHNAGDIFNTLTDKVIDKALRNAESYINSTIGGFYE